MTYALTLLIGFSALPSVFGELHAAPITVALLLPVLRLGVFGVTREVFIRLLWQTLVERLNIAASEMVYVTR
jgi:hypothetical protein